jgi:hypothetical protein
MLKFMLPISSCLAICILAARIISIPAGNLAMEISDSVRNLSAHGH